MKVLVTGGTGSVGKAATERLVNDGWDVLVIGRRKGLEIPGAEYASCDINCFEDVCEKVAGRDAVVHLAAIPSPLHHIGPEMMRVNVLGTFNVFEAAAIAGVRRIVQASSINAFGCFFSLVDLPQMRYFPVDEDHPIFTTDPYSFSKEVIEEVGNYYWRRDGISSVALRLPWVHPHGHQGSAEHRARVDRDRALLDELAAMPEAQRTERLAAVRAKTAEYRSRRPLEPGAEDRDTRRRRFKDDPLCRLYANDRFNFWAFVDERDSAQAIARGLTAEYEGSHVLFINDSHNWLLHETEKILELFFPDVAGRKRPVEGSESLVSIDKARALIAFEPEYSVASFLE